MKMRNMIAVLSALTVSAMGLSAMTFSASAADEVAQAYLAGSFGTESNWSAGENAGVSVASVDGDAQYECTWELAEATETGNSFFITVVIEPTGVDNFTTDTYPDLAVTLDEVWVDGVEYTDYDASAAVDTAYYEGGKAGVTRVYIRGDWANNSTKIIADDTTIESDIKVLFTVSGTGVEGTSNVTEDVTPDDSTPDDSKTDDSSAAEEESKADDSSAADEESKADDSSKSDDSSTSDTSSTSSTTTTTNTNTGDAGVAAVVAAVAVAGAAAVVTAKKRK